MLKRVVVIGGGTGTYTLLSGIRDYPITISALLTMADDGGSNKILRDEFGLLPTSGVRQAMAALSTKRSLLRKLFMYRFNKGKGISGMTFGNLFLAAVADIVSSQEKAIEQTAELLSVKGKILPISYKKIRLVATYENGLEVVGEHLIDEPKHDGKLRIVKFSTKPTATIHQKATEAIEKADFIVLGPGDFYTNTIANLVIDGVIEAIKKSKAKVIFIGNLMTKYGESYGYKYSDFLDDLKKYLPLERINFIIVNSDTKYPKLALKKYEEENAIPVVDDINQYELPLNIKIIRAPVLSRKVLAEDKGDILKRSILRHESKKLGETLASIFDAKNKHE